MAIGQLYLEILHPELDEDEQDKDIKSATRSSPKLRSFSNVFGNKINFSINMF